MNHELEKVEVEQMEKVLGDGDLLSEAAMAENKEHEMGVWEAAKKHPWACLWAFTMCFTIVRLQFLSSIFPLHIGSPKTQGVLSHNESFFRKTLSATV